MKIIDMLILISNKEFDKVPKRFMYLDDEYYFDNETNEYYSIESMFFLKALIKPCLAILNDEVEIIEGPKPKKTSDIEEIDTKLDNKIFTIQGYIGTPEKALDWNFDILKDKLNEVIRKVNKK